MDSKASALPTIPVIDRAADFLYVVDSSAPLASASTKATVNFVLGIVGAPVGTTDTQTLTGKTLTAPTISSPVLSGTVTGTYTLGGTPTFPATVVLTTASQTLTGKTLTAPIINGGSISNTTIAVDSVSEFTAANGVTIDGVNLKDGTVNTAGAVVAASIAAGAVTPVALQSGTGASWTWQTYVPTWTNLSVGNGTLNYAKYVQIGKNVYFRIKLTLGSTSTVSGSVTVSLPVTAHAEISTNTDTLLGNGQLNDATGARWETRAVFNSTTTIVIFYQNASANIATISATAPFTWTTSDQIMITGVYEAA